MNHALLDFIKAWSSHQSAERILEDGPALPDSETAEIFLKTLPAEERTKIEATLSEALAALETYMVYLKTEQADIKQQLDQTDKVSKACLSYARTPQKSQTDF